MSEPAIFIESLVKRYGEVTAVDHLSLEIPEGEFFGFLGPNGAGKTTAINAMVGLVAFQGGKIEICGHDAVSDYRAARACIGLSPQEFNFDRYLSIREILTYNAGYFGIPSKEAARRADELLERFDLTDKGKQSYMQLSGGMKRRLGLARALIHRPRVLILDEPSAGIDVELRLALWEELRELNRQGLTIFLTTHYIEEAQQLCSRIGIIDQGKLVALDRTETLVSKKDQSIIAVDLDRPVSEMPKELSAFQSDWKPGESSLRFPSCDPHDVCTILDAFTVAGYRLRSIDIERKSLQDIFLELIGKKSEEREC